MMKPIIFCGGVRSFPESDVPGCPAFFYFLPRPRSLRGADRRPFPAAPRLSRRDVPEILPCFIARTFTEMLTYTQ